MSTPNMGLVLPVDHGSADTWDVILDTAFGLIDAHDHTPGKGVLIATAALKIDADVSWAFGGTSRAITDLRAIDFSPQPVAGMTALAGAFFLSDGTGGLSANELYYRTTASANVKVTSGAALNVAGFTGGIGGDYSSVGALEIFDDATDSYWFQQQVGASVRQYARMRSGDLDLYEYKAHPAAGPVPTNRVRLKSPAALAASYDLTWLAALPGSAQLMVVDNAGLVTASNTVANLITANSGLTAGANQNITVSGTGKFKHPTITDVISPMAGLPGTGASVITTSALSLGAADIAGGLGASYVVPLRLRVGWSISAIRCRVVDSAGGGGTKVTATFSKETDFVTASNGSSGASAGTGVVQTLTITPTVGTVLTGVSYNIRFTITLSGGGSVAVSRIEVDYDQP